MRPLRNERDLQLEWRRLSRWRRLRRKVGFPLLVIVGIAIGAGVGLFAIDESAIPAWSELLPATQSAPSGGLTGRPSIVDADTIRINGTRIRFHGIDAPESGQVCRDAQGQNYRCGQRATAALANHIAGGAVSCRALDK